MICLLLYWPAKIVKCMFTEIPNERPTTPLLDSVTNAADLRLLALDQLEQGRTTPLEDDAGGVGVGGSKCGDEGGDGRSVHSLKLKKFL